MNSANEKLNIVRATDRDLSILCKLAVDTFRDAYRGHPLLDEVRGNPIEDYIAESFSESQMLKEINDQHNLFYILESDEVPIGYAELVSDTAPNCVAGKDPIHLERIYLLKRSCGKGYGKYLLNHCFKISLELDRKTVWLGVWDQNKRASNFYIKHGFKQSGSVKFRIGNTGYEDTDLIFERHI
jgi:ribosomal protein S18 acetylase RimI-like enzyme